MTEQCLPTCTAAERLIKIKGSFNTVSVSEMCSNLEEEVGFILTKIHDQKDKQNT